MQTQTENETNLQTAARIACAVIPPLTGNGAAFRDSARDIIEALALRELDAGRVWSKDAARRFIAHPRRELEALLSEYPTVSNAVPGFACTRESEADSLVISIVCEALGGVA